MSDAKTVLIITNIPTPYRIPLFNEIARQLRFDGYALTVVFGGWGYKRRKWRIDPSLFEFDYHVLSGSGFFIGESESISFVYSGLIRYVLKKEPFFTVVSGFSIAGAKLWFLNLIMGKDYCIWSGAIEREDSRQSWWRQLQRRLLVRRAATFIAYGTLAKAYLMRMGAERDDVFTAINTVDTDFFGAAHRGDLSQTVRKKEKSSILCIGDMINRKRLDLVLHALHRLSARRQDFVFLVIGDGAERARLERLVGELGLGELVVFTGFKEKEAVAEFLLDADCFVFPTGFDIWGLVLVEAMAAGVPCIASVRAGATHDLIEDGQTGWAVDFEDIETVAEKISEVLDDPSGARRVGEAGRKFVTEHANVAVSARGFVDAVRHYEAHSAMNIRDSR